MKKILSALFLVTGLAGFIASPHFDPRLELIKGYREWKRVTRDPVDMSPSLAASCVGPASWDSVGSPHAPKVFFVYVNKVGQKAMLSTGETVFPDGTVIVKEKHSRSQTIAITAAYVDKTPELLTVMVKEKGKWTYFAVGSDKQVEDGDVAPCRACHDKNRENDFVFRTYVDGAKRPTQWRG